MSKMFNGDDDEFMMPIEETPAFRKGQVDNAVAGFSPVPGVTVLVLLGLLVAVAAVFAWVITL